MSNFTILNGANVPLNVQTGTIPGLFDGMLDWLQPMTFIKIVKTVVAFQLVETPTSINFMGILFPEAGRRLEIRPDGQRSWNYISILAQDAPDGALVSLMPDEIVTFLGRNYRVLGSKNYSLYGFVALDLTLDYTGSGPS